MSAATRELSVTYGPILIGGTSTTYLLDGFTRHSVTDGKAASFVEVECVVVAGTPEALAASCAGLEKAFRTPRKSLTIVQAGVTLLHVGHDAASGGFNTEPEIRKLGAQGDSGRSRRYTLRVSFETPADTASTSGLRESSVAVSYDPSRIRTVRISGVVTGVESSASSRARYEALVAAHAASVKSALGITVWELDEEPAADTDYDDKVCHFQRTYRELVFGQGADSPADDSGIVRQSLSVSRREFSEDRSPVSAAASQGGGLAGGQGGTTASGGVQALAVFDLHYEASIDATVTTDLPAKYASVREWLLGQFSTVFGAGQFALTTERPSYDRPGNRIVVDMTAEGPVGSGDLLRRTATVETRVTSPAVFRGAWNGDPYAHYVYQGHAIELRVVTTTSRRLRTLTSETAAGEAEADAFGGAPVGGGGGNWILVEKSASATPLRIGIEGSGRTLDVVDVQSTVTLRKVNRIGGGGGVLAFGGGSGLVGSGPTVVFGR